MKNKLKVALIALLAATAVFVTMVSYCYVKANEAKSFYPWGMWIRAGKLSEEPAVYNEVPENVDKWTKKALENPDEWVYVENQKECWARGQDLPVKYKGEYYGFGILFRDGPWKRYDCPEQKVVDYSPIGFTALAALWAVLGVVWYKRRKP